MEKTQRAAQIAVIILAIIAVAAAMHVASSIFAPMVLALVVGVVLSPVGTALDRIGLPNVASSLATFFIAILVLLILIAGAQPIISRVVDTFPKVYNELNSTLYVVQRELRGLENVQEQVREMVNGANGDSGDGEDAKAEESAASDAIPTVEDVVFMAPSILARIVIFLGILFFFILTRKEIYGFIAGRMTKGTDRADVAMRLAAAERQVAKYFLTITAINAGLGVTTAMVMFALGMPSPIIWGGLAFVLNYLLYIGPAALFVALGISGIVVFDNFYAALPALCFLSLNFIESQFVTPSFLGKRLSINPLLIFISLSVFYFLWGVIGAVVAIPLLVWGVVLTADIRSIRSELQSEGGKAEVSMEPSTGSGS